MSHNNKWNFQVVRASLNLSARVAKNGIYYYECNNRWIRCTVIIAKVREVRENSTSTPYNALF